MKIPDLIGKKIDEAKEFYVRRKLSTLMKQKLS